MEAFSFVIGALHLTMAELAKLADQTDWSTISFLDNFVSFQHFLTRNDKPDEL